MSKDNVDETLQRLIDKLERLEIEIAEVKNDLKTIVATTDKKPQGTKAKDRNGTPIKIGCRVRFLTKGKYHSTGGTVTKIGRTNVTSKDNEGNHIVRNFNNVEIIENV